MSNVYRDPIRSVPLIPNVAKPAGKPHTESAEQMPFDDMIAVIQRLSPALRAAVILAVCLALRRGEICGLQFGRIWTPQWDHRSAVDWFVDEFEDPAEKIRARFRFEKTFTEVPLPGGLVLIKWQRTNCLDPDTAKRSEEHKWVKTEMSFRLLGLPELLLPYLYGYRDIFHGAYDSSDPAQRERYFLRSMHLDEDGRFGYPTVDELSSAVDFAMEAIGYHIDKTGHDCSLHLWRKSSSGRLNDSNEVSGSSLAAHLGHADALPEEAEEDRAPKVTMRVYMPQMSGKRIARIAEVTDRTLLPGIGPLRRFLEIPLRLEDGYTLSEQAAERIGHTVSSADWMARTGRLEATKTWIAGCPARRWAFREASVDAYVDAHSDAVLRPEGTMSVDETAERMGVSDSEVTLLASKGVLEKVDVRPMRIVTASVEAYMAIHKPEGTMPYGEAYRLVNEVVKVSRRKFHHLLDTGVIKAERRPKGDSFWFRPYRDSVEAYLASYRANTPMRLGQALELVNRFMEMSPRGLRALCVGGTVAAEQVSMRGGRTEYRPYRQAIVAFLATAGHRVDPD